MTQNIQLNDITSLFSYQNPKTISEIAEILSIPSWKVSKILNAHGKKISDFQPVVRDMMLKKRKNILANLNKKIDLEPWHYWFVGLVDGEGTFSITIKPSKYKPGITAEHIFGLRFHGREIDILEEIRNKLNINPNICKSINNKLKISTDKSTGEPTVCLQIKSLPALSEIIIPIFNSYPLKTAKQISFELWKESIYIRIQPPRERNIHRLVDIYKQINPRLGNLKKKKERVTLNKETGWYEF